MGQRLTNKAVVDASGPAPRPQWGVNSVPLRLDEPGEACSYEALRQAQGERMGQA